MRFPRSCGCLLHPTALPGPSGSGDFGADAYRFVDWLEAAGQRLWQVLPLGEIGRGNSPYMSPSAFAGNPLLIDLVALRQSGWLEAGELENTAGSDDRDIDFARMAAYRKSRLRIAAERFAAGTEPSAKQDYDDFCSEHEYWLEDYALFRALADLHPERDWCDWDRELAAREPEALAAARRRFAREISNWKFYQWCFYRQWQALRAYANARGIRVFGDMPIFVAYHSADVWARRELFDLDQQGRMRAVAGVPPDYFSATGQLWGNPLYRWPQHQRENYDWWTRRVRHAFRLCDLLRIDHFLGFVNYWEIPATAESAVEGRWLPGPDGDLFAHLLSELGELPIVAENLGTLTAEVERLRKDYGFPGMAVLQFAWSGDDANPHLPHNLVEDQVVYSGTHDNDTTVGWWSTLDPAVRDQICEYFSIDGKQPHRDLIRAAYASPAHTAIAPLQDYLGLGSEHRFNVPGVARDNWRWRFRWDDIPTNLAAELAALATTFHRR